MNIVETDISALCPTACFSRADAGNLNFQMKREAFHVHSTMHFELFLHHAGVSKLQMKKTSILGADNANVPIFN